MPAMGNWAAMVYRGLSPATGKPIEVEVAAGKIAAVRPSDEARSAWIAPGFIDLQVNGFAGVDYNSPDTPADEIARSLEVQRATGVTRLLPTIITGSHENIAGSLANLAKAKRELELGRSMVGFHVEGPWISPEDGPRGAHPREHTRSATVEEFKRFQDAAEGGLRLLTVAPEVAGALEVAEYAVGTGVTVAIGHTNASEADIRNAVSAGATMSTHLGNGAHQTVPRHDNYIVHQLAADELCAGLIVDGIHLPGSFVKVAVRSKGLHNTVVVTVAVPPAGCEPGVYTCGHIEVRLSEDGSVRLTSNGRLAGSALRMDRALENLMRFTGLGLKDALTTATVNAAAAIGLEGRLKGLEAGDDADLVLFELSGGGEMRVVETVVT